MTGANERRIVYPQGSGNDRQKRQNSSSLNVEQYHLILSVSVIMRDEEQIFLTQILWTRLKARRDF